MEKKKYDDVRIWWDIVKRNLKSLAINVSIYLRNKAEEQCKILERRLDNLKLVSSGNCEDEIYNSERKLNEIYEKRA